MHACERTEKLRNRNFCTRETRIRFSHIFAPLPGVETAISPLTLRLLIRRKGWFLGQFDVEESQHRVPAQDTEPPGSRQAVQRTAVGQQGDDHICAFH
jgi:hypothetical protein